ncbi:MAG: flagellin [Proteobacteria bacterium]|nr:flagellin [Pseudomonadota bacterium]MBU6425682.1 flagellin [Rhodospirillales bacterium]
MSAVGSILTNSGALSALNSIAATSQTNNTLQSELASGLAINSPADNPAGYITAQGFTSQLNGLTQATSNANQAVSLLQTAQSAIGQQISVVQQLNSIAVQAANGTQTPAEAQSLQTLVGQLTGQVSTIANQTQFNNINLLNGSFSGVQFQVGANEGQTLSLSIGNTTAANIGEYATAKGSAFTSASSGLVSAAGAFTGAAVKITGPTGGSGSFTTTATESAAAIAKAASNISGKTGVQAQATNTVTYNVAASANGNIKFKLQASGSGSTIGGAIAVNASSLSEVVSQINQQTSTSGIVASSASGKLTLAQQSGQNIKFSSAGTATTAGAGGTVTSLAGHLAAAGDTQQGQVQFQSSAAFTVSGSAKLAGATSLNSLANINVGTTAGANTAINVIKYALAGLNNQGGQLGAVQQRVSANINNLNATSQNVTTALGVVQDANIPQVANQLTQAQIQAQSGVAALKSSTQLQQSYLSLLP